MNKVVSKNFALTVMLTIILLTNTTINIAFSFAPSHKAEIRNNYSTNKELPSYSSNPSNSFNPLFQAKDKDVSASYAFSNLQWQNRPNGTYASFNEAEEYADAFVADEDSMELIVGIDNTKPWAYDSLVNAVASSQGKVVKTISMKGEATAIVADIPLNAVQSFKEQVQKGFLTRYIEPNKKYQALFTPNDPYWSLQWGPQKIEADWAWNTTTGSSSILVAVIDTGIDYNHPDLAANYVALGYDWVNNDADPLDDNGHGTHCAGIIAAVLNNALGIAGLGNVSIMAEKGLDADGWGSEDDLAQAIIHAVDRGAKILSNSWGGSYSELIYDAVKYAYNNGVLVVAAAGNTASRMKFYPAAHDEVIAVTATDSSDIPAYFTTFGDWVEVAAPGVDIYSTMPTYNVTLNDYGYSMNYSYMSGTSMACPHVAGVAALIWSQFANATRDWIRAQLRYTAEDLGDAGFDEYYGYGRINARDAVEQVPPEHDLLIFDWDRPQYVKLGEPTTFNVTVLNFGTSNETNVEVELLVNDSVINSTTISFLQEATSVTVSLLWTPTSEGTHNFTYYVVPVANETAIENNQVSEILYVITPPPETNWLLLETDPNEGTGTNLKAVYGQVYSEIVYFKVEHHRPWTTIYDIDTAIFIDADQDPNTGLPDETYPYQDTDIGADFVIVVGWEATEMWKWDPIYEWWDIDNPIPLAYLEVPENSDAFVVGVFFVDLETSGIADFAVGDIPSNWDWMPDHGYFTWLLIQYEHELAVLLDAPQYLLPEETSMLNATVCNRGLNNETNVEIQLIINGSIVANETLPELVNGTYYTLNFSWTPSQEGIYNVTAYAPPVPEENFTLNNVKTEFVSVHYPLINPEPGQYANYAMNYYDSSGHFIGQQGCWNLTYEYYIEPYKIYITFWQKDPYGYIYTGYMIVNTMNRFVEEGIWYGLWYPGWIETDIDIGSTINLLDGTATVNGTRMLAVGPRAIDCWEIPYSMYGYPYTFWYDKQTGLWIGMNATNPYTGEYIELMLIDTNVPIGVQYEHDLGVTLEAPPRLQPGECSVLNATMYNLGLNNESGVSIQLLINGTVVESETLTELVNGTSFTINYSWTPTTEGIYNITVYAPPVSGEDVTINNVASSIVRVRFIEVALISYYTELVAITPILDAMGVGYDIYNDNNIYRYTEDLDLLLQYKAVIFYNRYGPITLSEYATIESYLSSGGNLLVTGYDCLVRDALLANLVRSSSMGDNTGEYDLIVRDESHPIMNGPYGSFPIGYHIYNLYGDCDMAEADTARGAITVAELADGYDRIIATEGLPGKVVFWNGDGTYDWIYNSDCQAMLKNTIHWFIVRYQHELVVSLQSPRFLEPGDSAMLNATVRNRGLNNETNVELQLLINGTIAENVTVPQLLTEESYTISYLWAPTTSGRYNITVYAPPVPNENVTRNNVCSKIVPVQYAPKILAYVQYTDYYQDYQNTLRAIESAFGPNYELTELRDYTQLDLMLLGKDILLIPDQEYASLYVMQTIGSAWSETLNEFLENGGIIILCDGFWGYGGTYGILTGAGLMQISGTNYRSYYTLYLVGPDDPLAEGVSSLFLAPYYTVSFITQETNVVINDGIYPVVIHKKVGKGHIALLGFDFEYSNVDTEQILGNAVAQAAYITISAKPSGGSPGTKVAINGTKATANGNVSIYWDDLFIGNATANSVGDFEYMLTVPSNASIGVHQIMAVDTATGRTASTPFRVFIITVNPSSGAVGTKVTVEGIGFTPEIQARITFNDMLIGYALVDGLGNFTFNFTIPISSAEEHTIKAFDTENNYATAIFSIIDITPLEVQMDVGTIHFLGETAEFYVQTVFKGQAVNSTIISTVLFKPDGTTEELAFQQVATGLYKVVYTILGNETGTYTLVVAVSYIANNVHANGTSFKCFLVSNALTLMNKQVVEIKDGVATIQTDVGLIKLNLTAINATLENIFVEVLTINGTTATIQTTLGVMNGTIAEMKDGIATIVVPGVGQIRTDISSLVGTQEAWVIPQYLIVVFTLIAAASAVLSAYMLLKQRKTAKTETG